LQEKILGREKGVFAGGFAISTVFLMVKTWSSCGELVANRGQRTDTFCGLKIFHFFQFYFRAAYLT
jgi:hypothetical protein